MSQDSPLFAHGSIAMPRMVGSLQQAQRLAADDAKKSGRPEPVLSVDLRHPERAVEIVGYVSPDGIYQESPRV